MTKEEKQKEVDRLDREIEKLNNAYILQDVALRGAIIAHKYIVASQPIKPKINGLENHKDLMINQDRFENLNNEIIDSLHNQLDDIFTEGLKLKGFEFKSKEDMIPFIKERCGCVEFSYDKTKIFYVDNVPFLEYNYAPKFRSELKNYSTVFIGEAGTYRFI